jgi:hemerythrin
MKEKLEDYNVASHQKIAVSIYNWLATHILKDDMKYKDYALSIEEASFSNYDI